MACVRPLIGAQSSLLPPGGALGSFFRKKLLWIAIGLREPLRVKRISQTRHESPASCVTSHDVPASGNGVGKTVQAAARIRSQESVATKTTP